MNDIRRIEQFLKLIASAAEKGNYIDSKVVYANIIYLGVEKKRDKISFLFDVWKNYFNDKENIDVFVSPVWTNFCQFINTNGRTKTFLGDIKIYIPVDKEHIERSAIEIFEFLARENITHMSKISNYVRFDDIVIRTDSRANANKIMEFVNNNSYIKSGLIEGNPFAVKENNIAIAWDGVLSFNEVVSSWVSNYINYEKSNGSLGDVSFSKFYAFVYDKSHSLFEDGRGLNDYASQLCSQGIFNDDDESLIDSYLNNYYNVTKLLLMSMDSKTKKEDVYRFIDYVNDEKKEMEEIERIYRLRTGKIKEKEKFSLQQKEAFKLAFDYTCEKYGFENAKKRFMIFLQNNNENLITRYKGAKTLILNNSINNKIASSIVLAWRMEGLDNAIKTTYYKYGYDQVFAALMCLINDSNFSHFTNDNNCRRELISRFSGIDIRKDVINILKEEGYNISNDSYDICQTYLNRVLEQIKDNKYDIKM